jgi:peptidoglycan/LPS O-acetylase OafA/YrhL
MNRNQSLDVIRGFLSWTVVGVHVLWFAGYRGGIPGTVGAYAVDGFIILSGFVITQLLVTKNEPYGVFIFRRFMRLFPAFATCLILALLVRPLTLGKVPEELLREMSESRLFWWHLGAHASLMHGVVPTAWLPETEFAFLPPGWSISLEFQLYLVAPLVLWLVSRFGRKALIILVVISVAMFLPQIASRLNAVWSAVGAFLPQRFLFFLIGMVLFYLFLGGIGKQVQYWRGFVRLGEVSYSTYLVHWPVLACLNILVPHGLPTIERFAALLGPAVPITLLCSFLLYRFVERPGIALGRYFTKSYRATGTGSSYVQTFGDLLSSSAELRAANRGGRDSS